MSTLEALNSLKLALSRKIAVTDAIAETLGGHVFAKQLIRVFPIVGDGAITTWNAATNWRKAWAKLPSELIFFAEDAFGNQLGLTSRHSNVILWNHEDGAVADLSVEPFNFFEFLISRDTTWMNNYEPSYAAVFNELPIKPLLSQHVHWVTPLILGGKMSIDNTCFVERVVHLTGHGTLWAQLENIGPETEIVFKL